MQTDVYRIMDVGSKSVDNCPSNVLAFLLEILLQKKSAIKVSRSPQGKYAQNLVKCSQGKCCQEIYAR